MQGFKPFGMPICKVESIKLKLEEFESIRFINYEMLSQDEASVKMNVSRPTFTRIYNRALIQIAKSFMEGKSLIIEGGNYESDKEWFRCRKCYKLIQGIENHFKCENCPAYNDNELIRII